MRSEAKSGHVFQSTNNESRVSKINAEDNITNHNVKRIVQEEVTRSRYEIRQEIENQTRSLKEYVTSQL